MGPEIEATAYWLGWVNLIKLIAVFFVAVGVVLEFGAEFVGRPLERRIESVRELHITQLEKETADAKLELARLSTPRVKLLTPEAVASLVEKLKLYAGTKIDIGHEPVGREQWDFAWQLEPIFPKAGWVFVDWIGGSTFSKLNWTMRPHTYGVQTCRMSQSS